MKRLVVICGPNGSGKSTVISNLIDENIDFPEIYICPDSLTSEFMYIKDLTERNIKSMELAEKLRNIAINKELPFAFETVLSTDGKLEFLKSAKERGYSIEAIFITTKDPQINIKRVSKRAKDGGHDVPEEKIISRYERSMSNLYKLIQIADGIKVYDNSGESPVLVFIKTLDGEMKLLNNEIRDEWVQKYIVEPLKKLNTNELQDFNVIEAENYFNNWWTNHY